LSALGSYDYGEWDLWMVWSNSLNGYEKLYMGSERTVPTEYRVYTRVYKKDIWYVGTREYKKRGI
jgi:hypothetical protein